MALTSLTQDQRLERGLVFPRYLVDIALPGLTLHFATRLHRYRYTEGEIVYEPRILAIDGLGEAIDFDQVMNANVALTLLNDRWGTYDYLSQLNRDRPFARSDVSIYETRIVRDGEVHASLDSGRVLVAKLAIDRISEIDVPGGTFKLQLTSRLHSRRNSIGLRRVTATQFPDADKNEIGKFRNLPIGQMEYLPCRLIKTGAMDTLFQDLSRTASSVIVSGLAQLPWHSDGVIQIDDEQILYAAYSTPTKTFTGLWRGWSGTAAAEHTKGATAFQVVTEIIYEAASVPVDAITDVFVDNVRQPVDSKCQVFSGRGALQLSGYQETALVRFTVQPVIKKQVNVEVQSEHAHTTSEGVHGHSFAGAQVVTREGIGHMVGGHVENPAYAHDGDENTGARVVMAQGDAGTESFLRITLNNSTNLGAITGITVKVCFSVTVNSYASQNAYYCDIEYGGYRAMRFQPGASLGKGWRSYAVSPAAGWGGYLDFTVVGSSLCPVTLYVYDVKVEITCAPIVANSPASGVATIISGSTILGGESVADVIVGKEVVVHVRSVVDDAYGSVTGTPGALLERADHVFKWFLYRAGFTSADIGASFTAAGAFYSANGYNLAFLTHAIGTDLQKILAALAAQCRSIFLEWRGKFELKPIPTFAPDTVDFSVDPREIKAGPTYEHAPLSDIANHLIVLYRKDLRSNRDYGTAVSGVVNSDAMAAGYMGYLEDSFGAGDLDQQITLDGIRTDQPATDILAFKKIQNQRVPVTLSLTIGYRGMQASPGATFGYDDPLFGVNTVYLLTKFNVRQAEGLVDISGVLIPPWILDDMVTESAADEVAPIQTHVMGIENAASATASDNLDCLNWARLEYATTETFATDSIVLVQSHLLVIDDAVSETQADDAPLGLAWEHDVYGEDIMPASGTVGSTGWFEDDASSDFEPRTALTGADTIWETDSSGDLQPI